MTVSYRPGDLVEVTGRSWKEPRLGIVVAPMKNYGWYDIQFSNEVRAQCAKASLTLLSSRKNANENQTT